jgi:hypothetical protein
MYYLEPDKNPFCPTHADRNFECPLGHTNLSDVLYFSALSMWDTRDLQKMYLERHPEVLDLPMACQACLFSLICETRKSA